MVDIVDKAKTLEIQQRRQALQHQLEQAKETDPPLEQNGVRVCRDCGVKLDKKRLAARPESVRCVDCKRDKERRERRRS